MGVFLFIYGASFSLRMGQLSDPVATPPLTNEVEVPPPLQESNITSSSKTIHFHLGMIVCIKSKHFEDFETERNSIY